MRYFVFKSGRWPAVPYAGPSCAAAGVEPGASYATRPEAQAVADQLSTCNPVGFDVGEVEEPA